MLVVYDTEVQQDNKGNIPKRSRYYQSMFDFKMLKPGTRNFNQIKPVVIIFIASLDLFGKGCCRYNLLHAVQ